MKKNQGPSVGESDRKREGPQESGLLGKTKSAIPHGKKPKRLVKTARAQNEWGKMTRRKKTAQRGRRKHTRKPRIRTKEKNNTSLKKVGERRKKSRSMRKKRKTKTAMFVDTGRKSHKNPTLKLKKKTTQQDMPHQGREPKKPHGQ